MGPELSQPSPEDVGRPEMTPTVEPQPPDQRPDESAGAGAPPPRGLRAGVRPRWLAIVAIPLAFGAAGGGAWAATVQAQVDATWATITATQAESATTSDAIDGAKRSLSDEQASIEQATAERDRLISTSQRASVCISAKAGDSADIQAILDKQRANVDRTASGSKFRDAYTAAWKAFETAVDYMYNSYKAVVAGNISSANTWISKSNAKITTHNKQAKIADGEIKEVNKVVSEINGAREALDRRVGSTASSCNFY